MNERNDENWLDEQLRRAIQTTEPKFDAELWKRKFADEYRALTARSEAPDRSLLPRGPRECLISVHRSGGLARCVADSPWQRVTTISLLTAYIQGGEDALERQLDAALEMLGPWPGSLSSQCLFDDLECW